VGFGVFTGMIRQLAEQAGTKILVVSGEIEIEKNLLPVIDEAEFELIPEWKETPKFLQGLVTSDDWLVMMSVRKGKLIWQPYLDRLPGLLTALFTENNFSALVPPEELESPLADSLNETPDTTVIFQPSRSLFGLTLDRADAIADSLLEHYFGANESVRARTKEALRRVMIESPVSLCSEVVLLHTHLAWVEESLLFVGTSDKSFVLPGMSGPAKILIILLEPAGQDPAVHLNALAGIVRFMRREGMIEKLSAAKSFTEFISSLQKKEPYSSTGTVQKRDDC
jgi:mannitol/fructose-specific phosphotransferase system IIA component (Ntr-type)